MLADATDQEVSGSSSAFPGWEPFVPRFVHPVKVAIVEALLHIGEPLSAVEFRKVIGSTEGGHGESNVRYHLNHLVEVGVLEVVAPRDRPDEGSPQNFYFAPPPAETD